jgi:hypothetical protein
VAEGLADGVVDGDVPVVADGGAIAVAVAEPVSMLGRRSGHGAPEQRADERRQPARPCRYTPGQSEVSGDQPGRERPTIAGRVAQAARHANRAGGRDNPPAVG